MNVARERCHTERRLAAQPEGEELTRQVLRRAAITCTLRQPQRRGVKARGPEAGSGLVARKGKAPELKCASAGAGGGRPEGESENGEGGQ